MKRALIGGIGNVLLGDDGVGPYVVRLLESQYAFGDNVAVADLGTPALDLTHQIVDLHALILVDSVASDDLPDNAPPACFCFTEKRTSCASRQLSASTRTRQRSPSA